jgi:hypothetical protein
VTHVDKIPAWAVGPMMEEHAKQKAAMTPPEPQTAAGRALLDAYGRAEYSDGALRLAILAIEAEASLDSEALRAALAEAYRLMWESWSRAEDWETIIARAISRIEAEASRIDVERLQRALDAVEADVGFTVYEAWPTAAAIAKAYEEAEP